MTLAYPASATSAAFTAAGVTRAIAVTAAQLFAAGLAHPFERRSSP